MINIDNTTYGVTYGVWKQIINYISFFIFKYLKIN